MNKDVIHSFKTQWLDLWEQYDYAKSRLNPDEDAIFLLQCAIDDLMYEIDTSAYRAGLDSNDLGIYEVFD
jgi:hypothetical protein